jgi:tagatose 1,6-diphosphate aldolase
MEFEFLDPGSLIDRELELVAPDIRWIDDMLKAASHPMSQSDPQSASISRQRLHDFLRAAPAGRHAGDRERGLMPAYHFWMRLTPVPMDHPPSVPMAGAIGLRIGSNRDLDLYFGHFGYNVFPPARGNHYAERACRLLLPLAAAHGLKSLWITCNPDNVASHRTCQRLGAQFVDTVHLPVGHPLYLRGEREKCRYRLDL